MKIKKPNLQPLARRVAAQQGLALRLLLTLVLWGAAIWAIYSVQIAAVNQRLPTLQKQLGLLAQTMQGSFLDLGQLTQTLIEDPRLTAEETTPEATVAQRRALYEFSYIHRIPNLTLIEGPTRWQPANADPLLIDTDVLRKTVGPAGFGLWLGQPDDRARLLLTQPIPGTERAVVIQLPWPQALEGLPTLTLPVQSQNPLSAQLISTQGTEVWHATPGQPRLRIWPATPTSPNLQRLTTPIPQFPNFALHVDVDLLTIGANIHLTQLGITGLALLLTLAIFWAPTQQWRLRVGRAVSQRSAALAQKIQQALPKALPTPSLVDLDQYAGLLGTNKKRGQVTKHSSLFQTRQAVPMTNPKANPARPVATPPVSTIAGGRDQSVSVTAREKANSEAELNRLKQDLDEKRILGKIKASLENNQVYLLYHPVYSLVTNQIIQHEVLLRLQDTANELAPSTFIPVAQRHGLMPALDAAAFAQLTSTQFANPIATHPARFALNLSGRSMESATYLNATINKANTKLLSQLVFEVQSQELIADKASMEFLKQAQSLGVHLSVDYFGGGKAMLEMTKTLGFDYLKVNMRKYWDDMAKRKELVALARTAQVLGLAVVFEKIESQDMETFARRLDVPMGQGYFFAQPSPQLITTPLVS